MSDQALSVFPLIFVYVLVNSIESANIKCAKELSINISDGIKANDLIIKDGIVYDENNYYTLGDDTYGCACNLKICIRKCCPRGQEIRNKTCQPSVHDFFGLIRATIGGDFDEKKYYPFPNFVHCPDRRKTPRGAQMKITSTGHLSYINNLDHLHYCLDYFSEFSEFSALVCLDLQNVSNGITIGIKFICLTVALRVNEQKQYD